jgi:hypothetical protein
MGGWVRPRAGLDEVMGKIASPISLTWILYKKFHDALSPKKLRLSVYTSFIAVKVITNTT